MRSIACAACGTVRWDSSLRCPECGSATTLPQPPTHVVAAPPTPRRRVFDVRWREIPDAPPRSPNRRRERVEIAIALLIVGIVAAALFVYDAPYFGDVGASPQVLISSGTTWPDYAVSGIGGGFTANHSGTLKGGFQVLDGPAEICVTTFDVPFEPPWDPPSTCPSNATYLDRVRRLGATLRRRAGGVPVVGLLHSRWVRPGLHVVQRDMVTGPRDRPELADTLWRLSARPAPAHQRPAPPRVTPCARASARLSLPEPSLEPSPKPAVTSMTEEAVHPAKGSSKRFSPRADSLGRAAR